MEQYFYPVNCKWSMSYDLRPVFIKTKSLDQITAVRVCLGEVYSRLSFNYMDMLLCEI